MKPGYLVLESERLQQKVGRKPEREDASHPSVASPQETQPATVTVASHVEEEELEDAWGRPHFPDEDDLKRLLDGLRREAEHASMPGVSQKKYAEIRAVRAEYVRKKNASIRAYQQMQAAYQPTIDEQINSTPAESGASELWDEPEQTSKQDEEELGQEHPALSPSEWQAAVVQAEQRLAAQVQKVAALREASAEAKQLHGFGSQEWSEA